MKTVLFTIAACFLFISCGTEEEPSCSEQGLHSWNDYHWPTENRQLEVINKTENRQWQPLLNTAISDWNALDTPVQMHQLTGQEADVTILEARSSSWLGLAQVTPGEGRHILSARVVMNPILFTDPDYAPEAAQHVFCQELGHVLGLHHNYSTTCMNDCLDQETEEDWLACLNNPAATGPDEHDEEQLNIMYNHSHTEEPSCESSTSSWVTIHKVMMK